MNQLPQPSSVAHSKTSLARLAAGLLAVLGAFPPTLALADDSSLSADIQELKKGQAEIKQELEDIRKLLTPQPPVAWVTRLQGAVALGTIEVRGDKNAKVTMIEFSDYQCPFCKRNTDQTMPALIREYVDSGKMRYAFRDFPSAGLHPNATKAAQAARCAGDQGKYWQMHDRLFANQQELQAEKLPAHAEAIGLNVAKFRECLDQGRYAAAVQKDVEQAQQLGVSGTPTIVLGLSDDKQVKNGVIIRGAQPLGTFTAEIDKLLAPVVVTEKP
jgi:protein-disulfide isomerase